MEQGKYLDFFSLKSLEVVFITCGYDFHAIDKLRQTQLILPPENISILTDRLESESNKQLLSKKDNIIPLLRIDSLLFKSRNKFTNLWRNLVLALVIPFQVKKIKKYYRKNPGKVFHAITMYYMYLCYKAQIPYVATPQASEILLRPENSRSYRKRCIMALKAADRIAVDSIKMKIKIRDLVGKEALVLKNGFDIQKILNGKTYKKSIDIISFRGLAPLYQIHKIFEAREHRFMNLRIELIYPFSEEIYTANILNKLRKNDKDLARLNREDLYKKMKSSTLGISIPISDSSPRSVYECIFCGTCVAILYSEYYDNLPACMKKRIYLIDINDKDWLFNAWAWAEIKSKEKYIPSQKALDMCDQNRTISKVIDKLYLDNQ